MPIYEFKNIETEEVVTHYLTLKEREEFLEANPQYKQVLAAPSYGDSVRLGVRRHDDNRLMTLSAGLLVGGALGNVVDRLVYGYVVDFLDVLPPFYEKLVPASGGHFPSFNVADSCICIAAALLILSAFRQPDASDPKKKRKASA